MYSGTSRDYLGMSRVGSPDSTAKCTVGHPGTILGCPVWDPLDYMSWDIAKSKCTVGHPGTILGCPVWDLRTLQLSVRWDIPGLSWDVPCGILRIIYTAKCTVGHPGTIMGWPMWDPLDSKAKCIVGNPETILGCPIYSR